MLGKRLKTMVVSGVFIGVALMAGGEALAGSKTLEKDGYVFELKWDIDKKVGLLSARGNVQGGASCNNLDATILFGNSGKMVRVDVELGNYPADGNPVKFSGKGDGAKGKKKGWKPYDVQITCS